MSKTNYKIIELFAGVGGFRVGFDRVNSNHTEDPPFYTTIWSNQFEPATKTQHASRTYCRVFGSDGHVNEDIALVDSKDIPVHDILVGGFPCQDYSVARVLSYIEGGMAFPDPLDKPSRTIITSEGGVTPSRFKHVIKDPDNGRMRRLIPLELERLNMFPDNHTAGEADTKRAFFMGNALVCGIITRVGEELRNRLK